MNLPVMSEPGYFFTPEYEATVMAVRDGIERFIRRHRDFSNTFANNPGWAIYQQGIDDALFTAMDAGTWLREGECPFDEYAVWEDAIYQVTTLLCLPDRSAEDD